jgi:hypothetical protein
MRDATGISPDRPSRDKCLVTINVHLASLSDNMTINVSRDADGVEEAAIARAKHFARRFAGQT